MKKSNLDEMQEQALLKVEHNGCWLAFWGLLAAMAIECLLGMPGKAMLGEWVVFIALALYLLIGCLRKGIWDRRLKANWRTNLAVSAIAGICVGIFIIVINPYLEELLDYVLVFALGGGSTFVLCFMALTLCGKLYKKRREKLDQE